MNHPVKFSVRSSVPIAALIASTMLMAPAHASIADHVFTDGWDGPDYCAPGRITNTKVGWRYDGVGIGNIDVTQTKNVWGRNVFGALPIDMPWMQEFAIFWTFPRAGYLATRFTVPMNLPLNQRGVFTHGETLPGPNIDISISETCGDFYTGPSCTAENVGVGELFGAWRLTTAPGPACPLEAGRSYYLNVRLSDPTVISNFCTLYACTITLQNNHTP